MNSKLLVTVALAAIGLLGGCRASTALSYETCIYDSDCRVGTDTCIEVIHGGAATHICSSQCQSGGRPCPTDRNGAIGSCVSFDSGARFFCYQNCTLGSTLCEYGSSCVSETGGGFTTNICLPGGGTILGTVPSYGTCGADSDCLVSSDHCITVIHAGVTRNICSSACVSGGATCPTDTRGVSGSCVSFNSGATFNCYQMCTPGSSTCGGGSSCVTESGGGVTTNICLPGTAPTTVAPYAGCAGGMTCQAGTSCIGVKDAHVLDLCTVDHCSSDGQCPIDVRGGNGACVTLDGDTFGTCVERCHNTSECTYGSMGAERCTQETSMGHAAPPPGVCLPT